MYEKRIQYRERLVINFINGAHNVKTLMEEFNSIHHRKHTHKLMFQWTARGTYM